MRSTPAAILFVIALAFVAVVAPSAWPESQRAATHDHKFHAHIDAYHEFSSCDGAWGKTAVHCTGASDNGNNGTADGFKQLVTITWCAPGGHWPLTTRSCGTTPDGTHHALPNGYDRWMMLERNSGGVHNYLLGAVKWPNGPFAVVRGEIDKHPVTPTSLDQSKVEHQGGPLFLYVGYHGQVVAAKNYHTPREGYVFGFRGWLNY